MNNTQHGTRSGRSCLPALLDVYDNSMHMINNKSTVDLIDTYFSKAFDMMNHGILLHKKRLEHYRQARTMVLPLINMQPYVRITGAISQPHSVLSGVPQGTVFGLYYF